MKRKTPLILIIILALVLITACTGGEEAIEITEADIEIVRNLTFDDVKDNLTIAIEHFVGNYSYLRISDLEFVQDKLAVDYINEVKKFNNIEMRLKLEVDSDEGQIDIEDDLTAEGNFSQFVDGVEEDLLSKLLKENPYEFSRVITVGMTFLDKENSLQHSSVSGNIRDSQILTALRNEESESEKAALAKTFDIIGPDKESYKLNKFGIMDNLFIMDIHNIAIEGEEANLSPKELSDRLYNLVSEDIDFQQYINSRADELVIMFTERSYNFDL